MENKSECKMCGYQLSTQELILRFEAGLGNCPNCDIKGFNVGFNEEGEPYIIPSEFKKVKDVS